MLCYNLRTRLSKSPFLVRSLIMAFPSNNDVIKAIADHSKRGDSRILLSRLDLT